MPKINLPLDQRLLFRKIVSGSADRQTVLMEQADWVASYSVLCRWTMTVMTALNDADVRKTSA